MPKTANIPCAGNCGRMLYAGRGALPAGQATCHPCRAARRIVECPICSTKFSREKWGNSRTTCSDACSTTLRRRPWSASRAPASRTSRACQDCGASTTRSPNAAGPLCDKCRASRRRAHYRRKNSVRRGAAPVGVRLSIEQLGQRDGWCCHLCKRRVNPTLKAPHRRSPTFDHLIPVVDGGDDSPANLRLAHFGCNSRRGSRGTVQLLLFG